jgi:putative endonuclease
MSSWFRKLFYRIVLSRHFTGLSDRVFSCTGLGDRGELEAERYLLKQGLVILERGYQDKLGELDLIAVDNKTVVFVEVKTRTGASVSESTDAVDEQKQKRITRTAKGYLKWHNLQECSVRFDVVAVLWANNAQPQVVHYPNAFEAAGELQIY